MKIRSQQDKDYQNQYPDLNKILLTSCGGIYIGGQSSNSFVVANFNTQNNNQIIEFFDNNGKLLATYILLLNGNQSITLNPGDIVVTNDDSINRAINKGKNNIVVNPVSKIMIIPSNTCKYYIIYTNTDLSTIIYPEIELQLKAFENNLIRINSNIMIISFGTVKILSNILYTNFNDLNEFINRMQSKDEIILSNNNHINNGVLQVIADKIVFQISNNSANSTCLNGLFVALYDNNSLVNYQSGNQNLYIFGSLQCSQRLGFDLVSSEKYKVDTRLSGMSNALKVINNEAQQKIYINTAYVMGIEIFK